MKGWVDLGVTQWFWTWDLWILNPVLEPLVFTFTGGNIVLNWNCFSVLLRVTKIVSQIYVYGRNYEVFSMLQWTFTLAIFLGLLWHHPVISYPTCSPMLNTFNFALEIFKVMIPNISCIFYYVANIHFITFQFCISGANWKIHRRNYLVE